MARPLLRMPRPWPGLLHQRATIGVPTVSQAASGAPYSSSELTYTARCNLQPASSADDMLYQKETGRTRYTLFIETTSTTGTSLNGILTHTSTVTIDGVPYIVDGEKLDLCSNGAVFQISVFRET